jgi:hypothetical protein
MLILDVKLARHDVVPVLVASDGLRGYNYGTMPAIPGKILYKKEEIDLTKVDFKFPTMVDRLTAIGGYILHT